MLTKKAVLQRKVGPTTFVAKVVKTDEGINNINGTDAANRILNY